MGHHKWFHNQFPPCFPVLHCPLRLGKLQACPFPDVVFPPLLVCLVFFPLSLCLPRWFLPDLMNGRHVHTTAVSVSLLWAGLSVMEWSRIPACPRLMCFFNRGITEETNSLKILCLMFVYFLFYVGLFQDWFCGVGIICGLWFACRVNRRHIEHCFCCF